MLSRPLTIHPWHLKRQKLLHGLMNYIHREAEFGKMQRLYVSAAERFNRSILAMKRGKALGPDSMRAHYARWLATGRKADVFAPKWKTPGRRLITPEMAATYARRVASEGISIAELFRRLQKETGPLYFSRYTLRLALPRVELAGFAKAKREFVKAEQELLCAIKSIEAIKPQ